MSRYDGVMLERCPEHCDAKNVDHMHVQVAQCLPFLVILQSFPANATSTNTGNSAEPNSTSSNNACKSAKDFCFVEYMDVLTSEELIIGDMDEALSCARVRWHRSNGNDQFLPGKEYRSVPVNSIRNVLDVAAMGK